MNFPAWALKSKGCRVGLRVNERDNMGVTLTIILRAFEMAAHSMAFLDFPI